LEEYLGQKVERLNINGEVMLTENYAVVKKKLAEIHGKLRIK